MHNHKQIFCHPNGIPLSPQTHKFCFNMSKGKVMLEDIFIFINGIVCYKFISDEKTVNKEMNPDIFHSLRDAIRCPKRWKTNSWILLHKRILSYQYIPVLTIWVNVKNPEYPACSALQILHQLIFIYQEINSELTMMFIVRIP